MISAPLFFAVLSLVLLISGLALLIRPLKAESAVRPPSSVGMENLMAKHFRYLPQFRRVLSGDDQHFIESRLPKGSAKRLRAERREAIRKYVAGIGEDFACLDRLAREIASHSSKVEQRHEAERLFQEIRFRILYRLALLRLGTLGSIPFDVVANLSGMVGGLSREVESMMFAIQALNPDNPTLSLERP